MGLLCLWRKSTRCSSSESCYHCTRWNLSVSTTHRWEVLEVPTAECDPCKSLCSGFLIAIHWTALLCCTKFFVVRCFGLCTSPLLSWFTPHLQCLGLYVYLCAFCHWMMRGYLAISWWFNAVACFAFLCWKFVKYWGPAENREVKFQVALVSLCMERVSS